MNALDSKLLQSQNMVLNKPTSPMPRSPARLTLATVTIPALLLLAYLAQCAWFIGTQSLTIDEPMNIMAGLEQWRTGQYSGGIAWNDHPPLARQAEYLAGTNPKFQILNQPEGAPTAAPTGTRKLVLPDP